jgi:hypothetical protein
VAKLDGDRYYHRYGFGRECCRVRRAGRLHLLLEDAELVVGLSRLLVGHGLAGLAVDAVDRQQIVRHGRSS